MSINCDSIVANNIAYSQKKHAKDACVNAIIYQIGNILAQGANTIDFSPNNEPEVKVEKNQQENTEIENKETPEEENNKEALKANVIEIISKEKFDKFSSELQEDILNKFSAYKTVLRLNDSECSRRISNYVKALESRETQKQMGEYLEQALQTEANEGLDNCPITDRDVDIAEQKVNGSDEEFIQSLLNRGEGYLDMYDKNNDEKVSFEEFIALEEKDAGIELTNEEKKETEKYFNIIANGDGVIDAKDFASHLTAVARLYDGNTRSSGEEISYKEWFGAQMIGSDENITNNYNIWREGYQKTFEQ